MVHTNHDPECITLYRRKLLLLAAAWMAVVVPVLCHSASPGCEPSSTVPAPVPPTVAETLPSPV